MTRQKCSRASLVLKHAGKRDHFCASRTAMKPSGRSLLSQQAAHFSGRFLTINNARSSNTISFHSRLIKSGKDVLLVIPPEIVLQLNLKGNEDVTITTIGKRKIVIEII